MGGSEDLTVKELASEAGLDLKILTGDVGLSRVIENVHHSDLSDPTPWMADGTLLITHGAKLGESTVAGIHYLDSISRKTVALVVAVGEFVDNVSPEVIEHARLLGMPIIEAPQTLSIRDIFSYVYHAHSSSDMHRLRRALAVQSQLLDLLVEEKGAADIVAQLASTLDLTMVLFSPEGEVMVVAGRDGRFNAESVWKAIAGADFSGGPSGVLEADGQRIYVRRVVVHGKLERLLAAVPHTLVTSILVDITLSHAQRLLAVSLLAEREAMRFRRQLTSAMLTELFSREDSAYDLSETLNAVGINVGSPWRVAVLNGELVEHGAEKRPSSALRQQPTVPERIVDVADECLGLHGIRAISSVVGNDVIVLAVFGELGGNDVREIFADVQMRFRDLVPGARMCVGVSRGWVGLSHPAGLLRQAEEANRAARDGAGVVGGVVLFDESDSSFRLLAGQSADSLVAMRDRLMLPLVEHDLAHHTALVKTLTLFFENRMSVEKTASELMVHRNTLYKRLGRIEELLDVDLESMDDVMELYVSLKAAKLLETIPQPGARRREVKP